MAIVAKVIYSNIDLLFNFVSKEYIASAIAVLISMCFAIVTYFLTLVLIGGFTKEGLEIFPSKITKLIPKSILSRIK